MLLSEDALICLIRVLKLRDKQNILNRDPDWSDVFTEIGILQEHYNRSVYYHEKIFEKLDELARKERVDIENNMLRDALMNANNILENITTKG